MYRKDIENWLKQQNKKTLVIVYNKEDKLGVYCSLQSGILKDYTNHVVDRKKDIWGYMVWDDKGQHSRVAFNN